MVRERKWRWMGLAFAGCLMLGVAMAGRFGFLKINAPPGSFGQPAVQAAPVAAKTNGPIACIGSIEPEHGVIAIATPMVAGRMPILSRLLVSEGDVVKKGQTLAELSSMADSQAAARQAEARVNVAQRRVEQVKAGARPSDVGVAQAQIARLEDEARTARTELSRKEALAAKDLIPRIHVEAARLKVEQLGHVIEEARQRLNGMNETRGADLALAEAELRAAEADRERAQVEMSSATIRAPQAGRVIRVMAHAGEAVSQEGLLELAPTGRMVVIAEVYETDAVRVRSGLKARITADALTTPVSGTVTWLSPQIEQRRTASLDPSLFSEARIFKARIVIEDGEALADRIHAQVNVLIQP